MDKDLQVIQVVGGRGSGKTTRNKALLKEKSRKRIVVYDLKDEYPFRKIRGMKKFAAFMRVNWNKPFKISYVPLAREKNEHIAELSELCYSICRAQKEDSDKGKGQNITIVAEEMSISAPNQKYPNGEAGFEYAVNIAREWGVEVIGVSQRPAQTNADFRGNASISYYFRLTKDLDIKAIRQDIGNDANQLRLLLPHEYLKVENGQITKGKNTLSKK